jgi:crooked neck
MSRSGGAGLVKNRAPAPIQISAEQIVREAADRQEAAPVEPIVKIHDAEEYQTYLADRRKQFEDNIRYRREHMGNWVKYARFEEEHKEYERARSVFERAIEVDYRSAELWLRYAEFEMRNEFINHARNVLDRAVQLLPRVDFLWYKYVYMEEMVGDVAKTRAVFERWMKWQPDDNAWLSYARFETRCHDMNRAEQIMRRYVRTYPSAKSFAKFAKWAEYEAKGVAKARTVWEAALTELEPEESKQARLFQQFAAFEERQGEYERARVIYRHAVQLFRLGEASVTTTEKEEEEEVSDYEKKKRQELYKAYITFEKKHGDRERIEDAVLMQQRKQYKETLGQDPYDYDAWLEWAMAEEEASSPASVVRDVYEQAVANVPPVENNKDHWRRYIYLWIYYAVYEELVNQDLNRASQVYQTCLDLIPHKKFSFSKVWINAAKLYVRRKDLAAARKLLGSAIGLCGKEKIFVEYIQLELSLGEVDRCRALYTNYLKAMPANCKAWCNYADLEKSLGETERCRAIYELAVSQPALDMPEKLWKSYIDFEIEEGEGDRARNLYERLLEKTGHVKVWISFAQFEGTEVGKGVEAARDVFQKAYQQLKEEGDQHAGDGEDVGNTKEERVLLLDAWRVFEKSKGDSNSVAKVEAMMPRRIKRRRMRQDEQGNELGWEEYFDYQFPDDAGTAASSNFKILEMAAKWKEQQKQLAEEEEEEDSDLDSDDDDDD